MYIKSINTVEDFSEQPCIMTRKPMFQNSKDKVCITNFWR